MGQTHSRAKARHAIFNRRDHAPQISAISFIAEGGEGEHPLLGERERAALAQIGSPVRIARRAAIYREGDPAAHVFIIVEGAVVNFRTLANGKRSATGFRFAADIVGMAESGHYVDSAQAVTAVTAFKIPVAAMAELLHRDCELDLHLLCKLCDDLREERRHSSLLARHDALGRIAMFLRSQQRHQPASVAGTALLHLPMRRTDIASFVGLSLAAVSRTFAELYRRNILRSRTNRWFQVIDPGALQALIAGPGARMRRRRHVVPIVPSGSVGAALSASPASCRPGNSA